MRMLKLDMGAGTWVELTAYTTAIYAGILRPLQFTRPKVIRYQYFNGIVAIGLQLKKMT